MIKKNIFSLPLASSELVQQPRIRIEGGDLQIYLFTTLGAMEEAHGYVLRFVSQRAVRKRSEMFCTEWHVEQNYDALCEVIGSDWLSELRSISSQSGLSSEGYRHFMTYIEDIGCVEVIALDVELQKIE